jgi:lipopolysaccharide/colanic/teichoic acid biosynthesis glycosyltransferase
MLYPKYIKRIIDFVLSFVLIIAISPIILIVALILFVVNRGKIFFIQKRPGKNGKIFSIIKFMTMNERKDKDGLLLPDIDRLTRVGNFVRKTSLDELPQLFNVLLGDLSLVGPRPLLTEYLPLYNEVQKRRHEVKPGMTGWAQINGRNSISWNEKFRLDIWYVDNISFLLDMKIMTLTVLKIFKSEDVNSSKTITMDKFTGRN